MRMHEPDMSETDRDAPRNDFERKANVLIEKVRVFLHGNIEAEIVFGELLNHYDAEVKQEMRLLRCEMEHEKEMCEQCPNRHRRVTP